MQKNHFFLGGFRKKCHICIRNPKGGIAQLARAPALQAGGRRFDSDYLHKKDLINRSGLFVLFRFHYRDISSCRVQVYLYRLSCFDRNSLFDDVCRILAV